MNGALSILYPAIATLLLIVVARLALRNAEMSKQLSLAASSPQARSTALLDPLKDAPVAAFRVNDRGQIVWSNSTFANLFSPAATPENLEEAARLLGAPMLTQVYKGGFVKQIRVIKNDMREYTYGIIRWEKQNGRTKEVSCILLPQNQHTKQQQHQHRFEHDIVRLLKDAVISGGTTNADFQEVLETLEVLQPHVRRQMKLEPVDLVAMASPLVGANSAIRKGGCSITFTSPRNAFIHAESSDIALALTLLSEAVYELQPKGRIAVRIFKKNDYYQLDLQLPNTIYSATDIRDITLLSGASTVSIHARLRFALLEQIIIKHHGNFITASERGLGTIFEIQLRIAE